MNSDILISIFLVPFIGSLVTGLGILALGKRLDRFARPRGDNAAVQASHVGDTLRLGGVAVFFGLLLGAVPLSGYSNGEFSIYLLISTVPVFLAGLAEDLGYLVSATGRFIAALVSAAMAVWLLGFWINSPNVPGLTTLLSIAPVAIVITVLFAALYCHSVNLIDGMNGLSSVVVISSALAISYVAYEADLEQITALGALFASAMLGFLLLNWPKGRLLLGDAGAYGAGHGLVWLAIALGELSDIAPPAIVLILFWPLAETGYTIIRRLLGGKSILRPDRMHLHQRIRRGLEITILGKRREVSNPLTTALMTPMIALPVLAGVFLRYHATMAWIALAVFFVLFAATNWAIAHFVPHRRRRG